MATLTLRHGDCTEVLLGFPEGSLYGVVSDPPYGLEFMGKKWDRLDAPTGTVLHDPSVVGGFQDGAGGNPYSRSRIRYGRGSSGSGEDKAHSMMLWHIAWLSAAYRALKPGGVIKAFSGTRTFHHLAAAMAEVGFEGVHLEAWTYGSGFPKSRNVSKAMDKAAGQVKILSEKPAFGIGGHASYGGHADGATYKITEPVAPEARQWDGWGTALKPAWEPVVIGRKPE